MTPVGGLALVRHYLNKMAPQRGKLEAALQVRIALSNSDIVRAYLGLLVQGKSDFDAIEGYRGDKILKEALGIGLLASSPTLRQRLDAQAAALFQHIRASMSGCWAASGPTTACWRAAGCRWTWTPSR